MPQEASLPNDIRPLVYRQAAELTDRRWEDDLQALLAGLTGRVWWRRILLVGVGILQVMFIALWIYTGRLEDSMARNETRSTAIRDTYINGKVQTGSDECMAGIWPEGAVKGPTYAENGHQVTELCSAVSGTISYVGRVLDDEWLFRLPPSQNKAERFARVFDETFNKNFESLMETGISPPPGQAALVLARRALAELAVQGEQLVAAQQAAGSAAERLRSLQPFVTAGKIWTLIVVAVAVIWLVRGRRRYFE